MTHPLNDIVWCKLAPSPIHGVGVFAIRDIPKGTVLGTGENQQGLDTYSREHEDVILPEILAIIQDHHCFVEFWDVLPNPNRDVWLQCFMNHSADANSDGKIALRDIAKGEEITENFNGFEQPLGPKAKAQYTFL